MAALPPLLLSSAGISRDELVHLYYSNSHNYVSNHQSWQIQYSIFPASLVQLSFSLPAAGQGSNRCLCQAGGRCMLALWQLGPPLPLECTHGGPKEHEVTVQSVLNVRKCAAA